MGLFATMPVDEVTVQDIAHAVDMTSAAVYYHFASKEQILLEGLNRFADGLVGHIRGHMPAQDEPADIRAVVSGLMSWISRNRTDAIVYFVNSIGLNLLVEARRRETRMELVGLLRDVVRDRRPYLSTAQAGVIGVALVSMIESAVASMVNQDATFRSLGPRRFVAEVAGLAERIVGPHR